MIPPKETPMTILVKRFRHRIMDTDPLKNMLEEDFAFTDEQLEAYIIESLYSINEAEPRTRHQLSNFPKTALLLDGAMIQLLTGRGLLHLRNQIDYNDAGLSVGLDNKAPYYAQWISQFQLDYRNNLKEFKRSRIPRFRGVDSPMSWYRP